MTSNNLIEAGSIKDNLQKILDDLDAKSFVSSMSPSSLGNETKASLFNKWVLLHQGDVEKSHRDEVKERVESLNKVVTNFLESKGHKKAFIESSRNLDYKEKGVCVKEAKKYASDLVNELIGNVKNTWYNPKGTGEGQEQFIRQSDVESVFFNSLARLGVNKENLIEMIATSDNLKEDNQLKQIFQGISVNRTKVNTLRRKVQDLLIENKPEEIGGELENIAGPYTAHAGAMIANDSCARTDLLSIGRVLGLIKSPLVNEEYSYGLEYKGKRETLADYVSGIDVEGLKDFVVNEDYLKSSSVDDLVDKYAQLNHSQINKDDIESHKKVYENKLEEFITQEGDKSYTAINNFVTDLMKEYIKQRWDATGAEDKANSAANVYLNDDELMGSLLERDLGLNKYSLMKMLSESNDMKDRSVQALIARLTASSIRSEINKGLIREKLSEKDKKSAVVNASQKYAKAYGYEITNLDTPECLSLAGEYVQSVTRDLVENFPTKLSKL